MSNENEQDLARSSEGRDYILVNSVYESEEDQEISMVSAENLENNCQKNVSNPVVIQTWQVILDYAKRIRTEALICGCPQCRAKSNGLIEWCYPDPLDPAKKIH
jgi:hypothetical protein